MGRASVADAAAAKEAAERAEIAGALSVLRQVAAEWDNAVDALVEVAQQFDSASRELYAKKAPPLPNRTGERKSAGGFDGSPCHQASGVLPPAYTHLAGFSVHLIDHMVEPEAARAANHK